MKRTECGACANTSLDVFLDLGTSPVADAYTATADEEPARFPLQMAVCANCWLVQLVEVVPTELLFNAGYSFFSSDSPPLVAYHKQYAAEILANYGDRAADGVLEIGCNDGDLLHHFQHLRHLGIDPAGDPTERGLGRGLSILNKAFTSQLAASIDDDRFGLILANHVLAHVEDVSDVIAGIRRLLRDDGVAVIEVQYLPDLLINNAFDLAYHEHRSFFSLTSLIAALDRHGLRVVDAQLTDRQGGSLRVVATPQTAATVAASRVWDIQAEEDWLTQPAAYATMQGRAERIRSRLWGLLDDEDSAGRSLVGYAAPAKATTLLNFCHLDQYVIGRVLDPAPAKIGRFIPGTGIQIVAPDEAMSDPDTTVLLLAWNYASAIMRQYGGLSPKGGRWIIPLPAPTLL